MAMHTKMLIGFLVGLIGGLLVHFVTGGDAAWLNLLITYLTGPIGQIFLRLLFMLVIPLIFSALVIGVAEMGDARTLGRAGWRMLAFTLTSTTVAVAMGLLLVNLVKPGEGFDPDFARQLITGASDRAEHIVDIGREQPGGLEMLIRIVPNNVIQAAAANDVIGVMFFALALGLAVVLTRTEAVDHFKKAIDGLFDLSMTLINLVIRMAPYAVACLVFNLSAQFGWELLLRLGSFVGVALLAMAVHFFIFYPLMLRVAGGVSPLHFFRESQEAIVMAFSTSSSNATLPTTLRVAEENLGLPRRISRFVVTVGATANQNGTALFEGITVLFLAQFFGVELAFQQQLMVMVICVLGGIGTAGVPAGSLPVIAMICLMFGIPPEGIGIILGVDRFLDMCRTTVNVAGDLVAAQVISQGEKGRHEHEVEETPHREEGNSQEEKVPLQQV